MSTVETEQPSGGAPPRRLAVRTNTRFTRALGRAHLTVAGLVVLGVAGLGWLLARHTGSRSLYLLVYGGVLVMAASYLTARRRLAIDVTRSSVPGRVREGQTIAVELTVVGKRRASTLILQDQLDPALGTPSPLPLASLAPGEELQHTYTFSPLRRGVYQLGPVAATWSDPFGLTQQDQRLAEPVTLIVHPQTDPVHDRILTRMWEDPPIRPPASKPWPTGFEFYGMRDYVQGDDLRRVVWSAVAKTGKMLVRESEQGISDRVGIYLDTAREWHRPGEPSQTFETGVKVAASLCQRHTKDGFSVSLHGNDDVLVKNARGGKARFDLLDALARVEMGKTPQHQVALRLMAEARQGSHFVVITPHLERKTADLLRLVLDRGCSVVVVKLVWDESDPLSWSRAVELGCQVVRVSADGSVADAFAHLLMRTAAK